MSGEKKWELICMDDVPDMTREEEFAHEYAYRFGALQAVREFLSASTWDEVEELFQDAQKKRRLFCIQKNVIENCYQRGRHQCLSYLQDAMFKYPRAAMPQMKKDYLPEYFKNIYAWIENPSGHAWCLPRPEVCFIP